MKKKVIILFIMLFILGVLGLSLYLFVPIFTFKKDLYIEVNTKFDITKYKVKLNNKDIKLYCDEEISTNEIKNYSTTFYTKEKNILNRNKKVTIHIVDTTKPEITLNGENEITLNIGSEYKELGATSIDNYDNDLTDKLEITNNIDTTKLGEYKVTYKVKDSFNNENIVYRKVNIKDLEGPVIKLNRNINSYLIINDKIDINDFSAIDNLDGDVTKNVKVDGSVDNTKEGLYKVTYSVKDSNNNETILETTINVQNKNTSGIPVLMYHWFYDDTKGETYENANNHNFISKTNFEKQIKYLVDNNYYFPTYTELEDYIDKKIDLPKKSVILTDDDAKESFFRIAAEIIKKYKVPMTSFVITKKNLWKNYTDNEYIDFESHTDQLHVRSCNKEWDGAAMCATYEELYNDIKTANEKLNKDVIAFAYPFGHYSNDFIKALKNNNIHLAFTINSGKVKKGANKYKLPRVRVSRTTTMKEFISRL